MRVRRPAARVAPRPRLEAKTILSRVAPSMIARCLAPAVALLAIGASVSAAPVEVRVRKEGGRWQLVRDGQPYFIKGAGGNGSLEMLARCGGNSVRTWGAEELPVKLDRARALGLTVTAGIWLGQVRQGFDWADTVSLARERKRVRAAVEKHKDHPALLMWALGNEVEDPEGKNRSVWSGINDLARMVKNLDPRHPTMAVVAEIGGEKVRNFHALCPDVDILGINVYGGAPTLGERYQKLGGTKPYIVTEFGPAGIWESQKDAVGAYPEPTSTAKAELYRRAYERAVLAQPGNCLGSYAFMWGQKQEVTATWFSMFLPDGARLGAVDTLTELWTGKRPANGVPMLHSLVMEARASSAGGATVHVALKVSDPENDPLKVSWLLQREAESFGTGGDAEKVPAAFPRAILKNDATGAEVRLPEQPGLYRLFVFAHDDHGGAATANVPLRVEPRR